MKALTWQGRSNVRIDDVPDPRIEHPTDAIIRVTSTAICGSDLHLYDPLGPFLTKGDVLGHETMGVVEAVGSQVTHIKVGDRVVVPFNISCGDCWMCRRGFTAQCETTQVREQGKGPRSSATPSSTAPCPVGRRSTSASRRRSSGRSSSPRVWPTSGSCTSLTSCRQLGRGGVRRRARRGSLAVIGLGPVGLLAVAIATHRGLQVIGVDNVPERLARARQYGATVISTDETDDVPGAIRELTNGRGVDGSLDAVGMESHGAPAAETAIKAVGLIPDALAKPMMKTIGIDRLAALRSAIGAVRRAGTVSVSGVYGGMADPFPMMEIFDKGLALRMGQCHVKRWIDDIMPLVLEDGDPLGLETLATHRLPLVDAPAAYSMFQKKEDGCIKVVLKP